MSAHEYLEDELEALLDAAWVDDTLRSMDIRAAAMRLAPICQKCGTKQVQILDADEKSSEWRCRECRHGFILTPNAQAHAPALSASEGTVAVERLVGLHAGKRVLDPCCGSRMFWFDRQHPDVIFGDKRNESHVLCDGRTLRIEPDMLLDFTDLPFVDGTFKLVVFDPPHLRKAGQKSWMAAKYGKLSETWQEDLRKGFAECFRVLATDGVLVFKWNETQVKVREVLALTDMRPLFGHPTGRKGLTHWMVFMKPNARAQRRRARLRAREPRSAATGRPTGARCCAEPR